MRNDTRIMWFLGLVALAYATARYCVAGSVAWSDWPVFVVNKALALSALLWCAAWTVSSATPRSTPSPLLLLAASRAAFAHVVLSVAILSPSYYPVFFVGDRLSWLGGLALLAGVVTMLGLQRVAGAPLRPETAATLAGVVSGLGGLHAAIYGYPGWLKPATWPGGLPPITLLSFLAGAAAFGWSRWPRMGKAGGRI